VGDAKESSRIWSSWEWGERHSQKEEAFGVACSRGSAGCRLVLGTEEESSGSVSDFDVRGFMDC